MNYIKKKYDEKTIVKYHFITLIPLLGYGVYKNGIALYISGDIDFFASLMPLFYIIGFSLIIYLLNKILKKEISLNSFYFFCTLLFLPITYNYLLVFGLFILFYFLSLTKIKLPFNIMFLLCLYLSLYFFFDLSFLNYLESSREFNYTFFDLFIGKGTSYLFTSSILFVIISYIYLSIKPYYKYLIPCSFLIFYSLLTIIMGHFFNYDFTNIFGIFSVIVFLGASFKFTPNNKGKMFLYSFITALLAILLNYLTGYYIGIFISLLIMQIVSYFRTLKVFTK